MTKISKFNLSLILLLLLFIQMSYFCCCDAHWASILWKLWCAITSEPILLLLAIVISLFSACQCYPVISIAIPVFAACRHYPVVMFPGTGRWSLWGRCHWVGRGWRWWRRRLLTHDNWCHTGGNHSCDSRCRWAALSGPCWWWCSGPDMGWPLRTCPPIPWTQWWDLSRLHMEFTASGRSWRPLPLVQRT